MIRVAFLDFDGVLNDGFYLRSLTREQPSLRDKADDLSDMVDPARVARLNGIVAGWDVRVVVSSSWRLGHTLAELNNILRRRGYTGPDLHDVTPHLSGHERHVEIKRWLSRLHVQPDRFVVLDDDPDAWIDPEYHFVRTVRENPLGGHMDGLEDDHAIRARRILT